MRFTDLECSSAVAEKLWSKHGVELAEVYEALDAGPYIRRGRGGLYEALGRTLSGRYLLVIVRDLGRGRVRLVTARDMTRSERRIHERR